MGPTRRTRAIRALRRQRNWTQLATFCAVGLSGYVVNLGVYAPLVELLDASYVTAAVCSFLVAVTNNYVWNRRWTFRHQRGHVAMQGVRFLVVSVVALGANLVCLHALVSVGLPEVAAQALAIVSVTPISFLGNRLWSFRQQRAQAERRRLVVPATAATAPVWLIVPTYNEAENVEAIVELARRVLARDAPEGFRILIVDDGSPDGTGQIADRLAAADPAVGVLHRTGPDGLARAYLAGFAYALERGAGYILQMDADGSHDPVDLARLLTAARDGADLALGSRYVTGGAVCDWGVVRRLVSRGGSWYARAVLGVGVSDLTGGFKCFRAASLAAVDLGSIRSRGYAFQVELTYRVLRAGLRVDEVPIVFRDRQRGESKMSWRIALEAAWLVPRLRRDAPQASATSETGQISVFRPQAAASCRTVDA
jgi:dolichol-phosphate mannosyltransferase